VIGFLFSLLLLKVDLRRDGSLGCLSLIVSVVKLDPTNNRMKTDLTEPHPSVHTNGVVGGDLQGHLTLKPRV
jgi:hypothetical protein